MVVYAVDIETIGLNPHHITTAVLLREDGKHWEFHTGPELWNHIKKQWRSNRNRGRATYIYGHNHAYDFAGYADLTDPDLSFINDDPLIAKLGKNCSFLDTKAFFPMSLENAGALIGTKKQEHPAAFGRAPETETEKEELTAYCKQDCIVTLALLTTLKRQLTQLGYTPRKLISPGQVAMTAFHTWLKRHKVDTRHFTTFSRGRHITPSKHHNTVRKAYRGGYVRAFEKGRFPQATLVDKRSFYPWLMQRMRFPDLSSETLLEEPLEQGYSIDQLLTHIGVSTCTLTAPAITLPFLPIRQQERTAYPVTATLTGTWTHAELRYAQELGYTIQTITTSVLYREGENPFAAYIAELWRARTAADDPSALHTLKLLMNSLSGKFAQQYRTQDIKLVLRKDIASALADGYTISGAYGENYVVKKTGPPTPGRNTHPVISALVTAAGRIHMHRTLRLFAARSPLYCDTDGILFRGTVPPGIPLTDGLDGWSLQSENRPAEVLGRKAYRHGDSVHISGARATLDDWEALAKGEAITLTRRRGARAALLSGDVTTAGEQIEQTFKLTGDSSSTTKRLIYTDTSES